MTKSYDVDVIILSWNRAEDTIEAIRSALDQEGVTRRVIIVDQGSDEKTLAAIEDYLSDKDDVVFRKMGRNLGVPGGRNVATRLGDAPYIVALDNDAEFGDRQMLAKSFRYMDENRDLAAVAFRILNYFTKDIDWTSWGYPRVLRPLANEEFVTTAFVGAGHCIRREAFEIAGGYDDELFFSYEETDLSYRMLNAGYRIKYCADLYVLHKVSPEARVKWDQGRYYYMIRNTTYISYKTGKPLYRIVGSAALMMLQGLRNGIFLQCAKAIFDAVKMCVEFRKSELNAPISRLKPEVWRYIAEHDRSSEYTFMMKLRRSMTAKLE